MCGIVGYVGHQPVVSVLMNSLSQIEYRGYDSAGIVFYTKNGFQRIRSSGPLHQLKQKVQKHKNLSSRIGMGHTRWATHGAPGITNAHPHKYGCIQVVHNGVIENAEELKEKFHLQCQSQTDTEAIAGVIHHFYTQNSHFFSSVSQALSLFKGRYSFLALCENNFDQIIGCQNGPPLNAGFGKEKEFFISSDLPSLLKWTSRVCILDNQEGFHIQEGRCQFFSFNGSSLDKKPKKIQWTPETQEKKGFRHFMLKEIFDQPSSIRSAIQSFSNSKTKELIISSIQKSKKLYIVACGSSYYAGLYGKYAIEQIARLPVDVDLASEFQHRTSLIQKGDPVLFISQSGETADILSCLAQARSQKAQCIALCNIKNSSLDRMADHCLYISAGMETAVASTKAFTAALAGLLLTALETAQKKNTQQHQETLSHLKSLPEKINDILSQNDLIQSLPKKFQHFKSFLFLGRGPHYPIALEGALKMKELTYLHAEGCPFGEMKHGPLALVDDRVLTIGLVSQDPYLKKNKINLAEIHSRKGCIATVGSTELKNISAQHISIPKTSLWLSPILEAVPLQLLAYHFADFLGHNVDQPRNLAKSVTVE